MTSEDDDVFPELIVFDCDMCLWSPEMYELGSSLPTTSVQGNLGDKGRGTRGAANTEGDVVELFDGALAVLQDFALGKFGKKCRIAAASSADNAMAVRCAHECMRRLEVLPGKNMSVVFSNGFPEGFHGNLQIGREGKLSSNKTTHFRELQKETGIKFENMLFFDDCNWGDNCKIVGKLGVTTMRTPRGLTRDEFQEGLVAYRRKKRRREAS